MAAIVQVRPITDVPDGCRASMQPSDPDFYQDPYRFYAERHAVRPAFFWEEYGHWCFSDFKSVSALLRDRRFGRDILHVATRQEIGLPPPQPHTADFDLTEKYSLLNLEPPSHTRLRTLVHRAFVSRQVELLRPRIADIANAMIDGFETHGSAELIKDFAAPIPAIVIAEMIGLPAEMAPQLIDWSNRMVRMYMFGVGREVQRDANRAAADFTTYLRSMIAERRKQPREDLLSHMISAEQAGERLSEDEIISTAILLLNAGHEATVHTTGNAIKAILESGYDPRMLFADETATAATIEEALRFDAPLHMFTRYALEDIEYDGISLRKGDVVGLMLGAANRDPSRFTNPNTFDPLRSDGANVSFGAGIHFCIGAPLARLEMQIAMAILFERLPKLHLTEPPRYADVYHFHGLERLNVSW
ncbi:cytochrome P450 [Pelagibacterium sp.]|uniref:cytochrome P450 n=1 Tax=Pelagibacterium sp. TaxID=1967288 RepID=UPI003A9454A1